MKLLSSFRELFFGKRLAGDKTIAVGTSQHQAAARPRRNRRCQIEALESRQLMAANVLAPPVLLGSVYFEEATGDDSQPDVIQVSFEGGAAGTTLNRLVIDGDKLQDGLTTGDIFFDTEDGGLGAFQHVPYSLVSHDGFTVNSATVVDGGSKIEFMLTGFDAGEKLVFSIDVDEAQFVEAGANADGHLDPSEVDSNSLVEGAEFQRSIMTGEFSAPHFVGLTLTNTYHDKFNSNFQAAQSATGLVLDLPDDAYSPGHDFTDRTAGAVKYASQIPLATISGHVYHDRSNDGEFNSPGEEGIGGVTLELLKDGVATGITTTTSNNPSSQGYYEFIDLLPGNYGMREVQPDGWLDGKDKAGSHGGIAADESAGRVDRITGAVLTYGDHGINYNFGEILPGSIRGTVQAHNDEDCDFDHPEILLSGVQIDLMDGSGIVLDTTFTDENGAYEFTGLAPGEYQVREHQPSEYYDGDERIGTAGGESGDIGEIYSLFTGIQISSGVHAFNYDFCEHVGVMLSGNVYHDRDDDGNFDRGGANPESGIGSVVVKLLAVNDNGVLVDTGVRATTNSAGFYKFNNLRAGKYAVMEIQPTGWLDGKDTAGNLGGVVEPSPPGDMISMIMINWGAMGTEYNFGELLPGSIRGRVVVSDDGDCDPEDPNEPPLAGVDIDLLDETGAVIKTTTTDANGYYEFTDLRPGTYAVHEHQPDGYYDLAAHVGDGGGIIVTLNDLGDIDVGSDEHWVHYDFCESPPGSIAGQVQAHNDEDCDFDHPEIVLEGVTVELLDGEGNFIRSTATDQDGRYHFDDLPPGTYQVHELQPAGYYDGDERVGTAGGIDDGIDTIYAIELPAGKNGVNYDFCEHVGVMLSGNVYHDRDDDGNFDRSGPILESGIGNAVVKLLAVNDNGQLVDTGVRATTDSAGFYKFNNLRAGKYAVMEIQPTGWLDGKDTAGNLGGVVSPTPPGDMISMIMINWGQMGTEYNFGELLPGSIRGSVQVSTDPECDPDDGEPPIAGVQIDLLDETGAIVGTTHTDANGEYEFVNLRPGTYHVHEHQPSEYFDLMSHVGSGDGVSSSSNDLSGIHIGSDQHLTDYDFCEEPPAEISGYVYVDGAPIVTGDPLTPQQVAAQRDGLRTADDTPLDGVVMHLVDGHSGEAIFGNSEFVLPGHYSAGPITAITDAAGFYQFTGLKAGTYAVTEDQPALLTDHLDTAGQHDGLVLPDDRNHGLPVNSQFGPVAGQSQQDADTIEMFREQFGDDAIVLIPLPAGEHSHDNDFSEVQIQPPPPFNPPEEPQPPPEPPVFGPPAVPFVPKLVLPPNPPPITPPDIFGGSSQALGFTWHLSVVNAGQPRSIRVADSPFQFTAAEMDAADWQNVPLDVTHWTLARVEGGNVSIQRELDFGNPKGKPVAGDFNGDGVCEVGVYIDGRWYIDLNGNGVWDEGDLWAKLGTDADNPVTGDWDDDGKFDIGIYGPAWPRDPWAIEREPGLPDVDNFPSRPAEKAKNMPPLAEDATSGGRVMKRTAHGKARTDLIDHVFHYGTPGDVPITGDWNGDGIRDIGVFRDGQWNLDLDGDGRFTDTDATFAFGQAGDLPVVGDFNGDGVDEVGIFRNGKWILDINGDRQIDAHDQVFELGEAGDVPVVGDWNGDGTDDPGTYRAGVAADRVSRRAG